MKQTPILIIGAVLVLGIGYTILNKPAVSEPVASSQTDSKATIEPIAVSGSYIPGGYQYFSQAAYAQALLDGKTVIH